MIQKKIEVDLGDRSYPIYVGSECIEDLGPVCRSHHIPDRIVLISDRNVAKLYLEPVAESLTRSDFHVTSIIIPPGENQKSLKTATKVYSEMLLSGVGRSSAIAALGGGVIGDFSGFIAATYHRGLKFIQIPTTLLSQVDSSIGGKVAVNHPLGKNMIGAFYQPVFVWVDLDFLSTLPKREIVCGLGEIVKYGIIEDPALFTFIEENLEALLKLEKSKILHVQHRCSSIKAQLTAEDEKEQGRRAILNCGHTIGHALEAASGYRLLKHGEAVLLGLVAESFIAHEKGLLQTHEYNRIRALIGRIPIKIKFSSLDLSKVIKTMEHDKKSLSGKKRFVLPIQIGATKVVDSVDRALIRKSLRLILR